MLTMTLSLSSSLALEFELSSQGPLLAICVLRGLP
jgi:hypothetical protein